MYWYPTVRKLPIPQPRTKMLLLTEAELAKCRTESFSNEMVDRIKRFILDFGLPAFIRTDLASGKWYWKNSCFCDESSDLKRNIIEVIYANLLADILGLDFRAIVVREYIQMDGTFRAFSGDMPVNSERRYFIHNGKVLCHHPYWIPEAIEKDGQLERLPKDWRLRLERLNTETEEEVSLLSHYSKLVGEVLPGYWSIDFCKSKSGKWYLIDMAEGIKSWHPDCPIKTKMEKLLLEAWE